MTRVADLHRELARLHTELATELERAESSSEFVPEPELQQLLGSRATIRRLIKEEKLDGSFSGRRIIVRRTDLEAFLETRRARARRKPEPPPAVATNPGDVDLEAIANRAGLRLVGGKRRAS